MSEDKRDEGASDAEEQARILLFEDDDTLANLLARVLRTEGYRVDAFDTAEAVPSPAKVARYDVVLSDMAPNTTGNRVTDQTRSYELFLRALAVAAKLGKIGGSFVGKIFMSDDLPAARAEVRRLYESERLIRPEGTRAGSMEIFVLGSGKSS